MVMDENDAALTVETTDGNGTEERSELNTNTSTKLDAQSETSRFHLFIFSELLLISIFTINPISTFLPYSSF
jgi:hypothetical protein